VGTNCRCVFDDIHVMGASRRGERAEAMGRRVTEKGTNALPNFGNLMMVARPYYCLSEIIRQLVRGYNELCYAPRTTRIQLINAHKSRVTWQRSTRI
jgi:hypothetical protein